MCVLYTIIFSTVYKNSVINLLIGIAFAIIIDFLFIQIIYLAIVSLLWKFLKKFKLKYGIILYDTLVFQDF